MDRVRARACAQIFKRYARGLPRNLLTLANVPIRYRTFGLPMCAGMPL